MSASSSRERPTITSHSQRLPFDHLSGDVGDPLIRPSQEARDSNPGAISIAPETQSVDLGDRIMQRGVMPMSSLQESSIGSNQAPPTHNPSINTSGGAFITTAHFTGGGHAIGKYSTVINNAADNDELKKVLSIGKLPFAQADYKDYKAKKKSGACFQGTRAALLREMEDWVNSPAESKMYVLSGLAGIGKSTVAYTIAERAAKLGLLAASFFFSRDEVDRKNATKFFTTITYQLCVYDETFAKAIQVVLLTARGHAATTKSPQEQLQILIVEPLRSIVASYTRQIVVVVDALDECDEADEGDVVMGLSQLVRLLPTFKVILTTRPQPLVSYLFDNHDGHKIFYLQNIEEKVIDADVRLYLSHCLSQEQVRARLQNSNEQWFASDEEIDFLVQATGRLFIIASTALRLILDVVISDPAAQMKKLLGASAKLGMPFKDLNEFYNIILRNVVPVNCDEGVVNRYQSVIGAILFVQQPLPVATLACLIEREEKDIRVVLNKLQSVILLGTDDIPRVYHKSFPDYITDSLHCQDVNLCVDPGIHHTLIATRCIGIMNKHLKYNILGLGDPARFMDNEAGLKEDGITDEQLQEKIPRQAGYAVVYWANHLEVANMKTADLMRQLEKFGHEHMLHWFEVLSLIGKLGSAHIAIRAVMKLLKSTPSDLDQLLSDALRFISKFYGLIEQSALHVYYSALPFTPTGSLLYRQYIKQAIHNVWGVDGGSEQWDALVASLNHGECVKVIKFSLDCTMFVSFSEYERGKLKIWDATTGTPISTIPGQRFAVANDFSTIASSKDNIITFYNVDGSTRSTMITTSSKIEKMALSSESSRVAAVLSNGTICLWDSRNAEAINSFDGFNARVPKLEFSSTGTRLAYESGNWNVKLRHGTSGGFIADLKCRSWRLVFSADGSRMASLSYRNLTLWRCDSGKLIGDVSDVGDYDLAISANGSLLATADSNRVTLWSENGGQLRRVKEHSRSIGVLRANILAFSRDNILAFVTENTVKLYDVKTDSFISTLPFVESPTSLAFSPDCTRLAAGSVDGTMSLWDIRRIDASSPSRSRVTALAVSRDCSRLACGFNNGIVELWETTPTMRRIETWMQQTLGFDPFRRGHPKRVTVLVFSLDGRLFASGSDDGRSIRLWNGRNGALRRTLKAPRRVRVVAVSNGTLAAGWDGGVTLWTLDTLRLIHTFELDNNHVEAVSITENSAFAAVHGASYIDLLDIVNRTTIVSVKLHYTIRTMSFLPNNSHLVAQSIDSAFLSLDLNSKDIIQRPMPLEDFIQLPNIPLWHGIPIWYDGKQRSLVALFSQHVTPVPVLRIPRDFYVKNWTLESSMIVLSCEDGRVIFLRLLAVHAGCHATPSFISLLNRTR